ncbi:MAG TPA: CoA-transferase [Sphingomonas sp.]|nr:CoA-transferase [Sphingomonas sp.]
MSAPGPDKRMTAEDVVARLESGMTIGIGGWGPRRKPMALVRAILRSDLTDLTVAAYGGPECGMLLAAGKVRKLIYGFVSMDVIPTDPFFRKARQAASFEAREIDEGLLQWGLRAAAMRVPFLPTRTGLGSDVLKANPDFKLVASPYEDGEVLLAMPAIRLDAALLHATRADRLGNTLVQSPDPFFDEHFARAADACYVSADEVVDRLDLTPEEARYNLYERCFVTGVVETPFGAHPTASAPNYGWDVAAMKTYVAAADAEGGWEAYAAAVLGDNEADYVERAGGGAALAALPLPAF